MPSIMDKIFQPNYQKRNKLTILTKCEGYKNISWHFVFYQVEAIEGFI